MLKMVLHVFIFIFIYLYIVLQFGGGGGGEMNNQGATDLSYKSTPIKKTLFSCTITRSKHALK